MGLTESSQSRGGVGGGGMFGSGPSKSRSAPTMLPPDGHGYEARPRQATTLPAMATQRSPSSEEERGGTVRERARSSSRGRRELSLQRDGYSAGGGGGVRRELLQPAPTAGAAICRSPSLRPLAPRHASSADRRKRKSDPAVDARLLAGAAPFPSSSSGSGGGGGGSGAWDPSRRPPDSRQYPNLHQQSTASEYPSSALTSSSTSPVDWHRDCEACRAAPRPQQASRQRPAAIYIDDEHLAHLARAVDTSRSRRDRESRDRRRVLLRGESSSASPSGKNRINREDKVDLVRRVPAGGGEGGGGGEGIQHVSSLTFVPVNAAAATAFKGITRGRGSGVARGSPANAALRRPRPYPIPTQDRGGNDDGERTTRRRKKKSGPRKAPRKGHRAENAQELLPGVADATRRPFLLNQNNTILLQPQQDQGLDTESHIFYRGEKALSGEVAWPLEGDPYICLHYGSTVARRRRPRPSVREVRTWQKAEVGGDGDDGGALEENRPSTMMTSWGVESTPVASPPPPPPPPRPKSQRAQVVIQLENVAKGPEDILDEWNGNPPGSGGISGGGGEGGGGGGVVPMGYNVWFESAGLAARPLSEIQPPPLGGGGGDGDISGVPLDNRPDRAIAERRVLHGTTDAPKCSSPSSSPSPTPSPSPLSSVSPPAPSPLQMSPYSPRPPTEELRERHAPETSIREVTKMEVERPSNCLSSVDPEEERENEKEKGKEDGDHHHQGLAIGEEQIVPISHRGNKDLTLRENDPGTSRRPCQEPDSPWPDLPTEGVQTCSQGQKELNRSLNSGVPRLMSPSPEDVLLSGPYVQGSHQNPKPPRRTEITENQQGGCVRGGEVWGGTLGDSSKDATLGEDPPQQEGDVLSEVNGNLNEAEGHRKKSLEPSGVVATPWRTLPPSLPFDPQVLPCLMMMQRRETNIPEGMDACRNDDATVKGDEIERRVVAEGAIPTRRRDDFQVLPEKGEPWLSAAAEVPDGSDFYLGPWKALGLGPGRRPKGLTWSSTLPQSDSRLLACSVWGDYGRREEGHQQTRKDRCRSLDIFPVLRLPLGNQPRLVDVLRAAQAKEEAAATAGGKNTCEEVLLETPRAGGSKVDEDQKVGEVSPLGSEKEPNVERLSSEAEPCPSWWGLEEEAEEVLSQLPTSTTTINFDTVKPARRHTVALAASDLHTRNEDPGRGSSFAKTAKGRFGTTVGTCPSAGLQKHRASRRQGLSPWSGKESLLPEHRAPRSSPVGVGAERREGALPSPPVSSSGASSVSKRAWDGAPYAVPSQDCDFTCHEQCQDLVTLDCKTLSQGGGGGSSSTSSSLDHLEDPFSIESPSTPASPVGCNAHPLGGERSEGEEEEEEREGEEKVEREGEEEEGELQEEDRSEGAEGIQKLSETSEGSTQEAAEGGGEGEGTAEGDEDVVDGDAVLDSTLRVKEEKQEENAHEKDQFEGTLRVTPRPTMIREVSTLRKSATRLQSHLVGSEQLEEWVAKYNASSQGLQITKEQDGSFRGCIRVHLNLSRPINIVAGTRPPSIYDILQEDRTMEKTLTSFYMPRDAVKAIHVTSKTTTGEVIVALLRKFKVVDNPQKFALYERTYDTAQSTKAKLRRLGDQECPLVLALNWSAQGLSNKRLVLQENDTADIQWEAFTLPELSNFLRILDREEEEYRCQICDKYDLLRKRIQDQLLHIKPQR